MTEKGPPQGPNLTVFEGRKSGEKPFFLSTADYAALSSLQADTIKMFEHILFFKENIPSLKAGWKQRIEFMKREIPRLREVLMAQAKLSRADPNLAKNRPNFEEEMVIYGATLHDVENNIKAIESLLDSPSKD